MSRCRKTEALPSEDSAFLENFYEKYKKYILYIAWQYTRDTVNRDDLAQESVYRLMGHVSTLRRLGHPAMCGYIKRTVEHTWVDLLRKKHDDLSLDDAMLREIVGWDQEIVPYLSTRLAIRQLKKELTPREWLVLERKYLDGYSQEKLGALLGVAPDSVRMLVYRARVKAKAILCAGNVTGGGGIDG